MRTLFILLISIFVVSSSSAHDQDSMQDTLTWFEESLVLEKDGSAKLTLSIVPMEHYETLKIPFQFEGAKDFSITGTGYSFEGGSLTSAYPVKTISGSNYLMLGMISKDDHHLVAQEDTTRIICTVSDFLDWEKALKEHQTFSVGTSFTNTTEYFFSSVAISLIAPDGYSIHEIKKTIPSYNPRKSPTPPFLLDKVENRYRVTLSSPGLNTGGNAEIGIHIKKERPGLLPLIIGIILAIACLIFYRDVLKRKE